MSKSNLTIAIPTYNRVDKLKKQIDRLLPQMNEFDVLLISDNATPGFSSLDLDYFNDNRLFFCQNNENIGITANIVKCFEKTSTDWMWLLSDDDEVLPDALDIIRRYISDDKCDFVNFTTDLCVNNQEDIICDDFDMYLSGIKNNFGNHLLISNNLYRMTMIRPCMKFLYWGCFVNAPHLAPVYYSIENDCAKITLSKSRVVNWNKPDINETWCISAAYNVLFLPDVLSSSELRKLAIKSILSGLSMPEALIAQLSFNKINEPENNDKINYYAKTIMNLYIEYGGIGFMWRARFLKLLIKFPKIYLFGVNIISQIFRKKTVYDFLQKKKFSSYL
ncbi:glycosyltransferase [Yersinia ruckeri]|uniref:glycosyltransferase family 2 protein n=1 Tax=Yersinia ruckeri TaxID=29486 RepID=UPI00226565B2|nr:glycosyltransferase [Yersinia ruckeri]UZX54513.1 glycosyltransferase [Yersinia ruckeri]